MRHSIIDLYRRRGAQDRFLERIKAEFPEQPDGSAETALCHCLEKLLPDLPAQYRESLKKVDLDGVSPRKRLLNVSANNVTVRLHRARKRLRAEIERMCRLCSKHGCPDCSCEPTTQPA